MVCKNCKIKPVIKLTNNDVELCRTCFIRYFEKKAMKTIRQFKLLEHGDHVVVGVSGGKDSLSVLYLLKKLMDKMKISVTALLIDEGIKGYRDKSVDDAKKFCEEHDINLKIYSYEKKLGKSLDKMKEENKDVIACSMCGVFRRKLLNEGARELKADKLATGHNMDDEAQSIFMNQIKNNMPLSARLGPITGVKKDKRFVPRIKPFYLLTEKEVGVYAFLKGFISKFNECNYCGEAFRFQIRDRLNDLEEKYPGSKNGIVNSFLEVLPVLKEKYKGMTINSCKNCGEPTSSEICTACKLMEKIKD
tara:strand:- start:2114 stop:3028 length:915 start_codon:yes stop_codon:yes gene_type:complete